MPSPAKKAPAKKKPTKRKVAAKKSTLPKKRSLRKPKPPKPKRVKVKMAFTAKDVEKSKEWWGGAELIKSHNHLHGGDSYYPYEKKAVFAAMALLLSHLTPDQLKQFKGKGRFSCKTPTGATWWVFWDRMSTSTARSEKGVRHCWYPWKDRNGRILPLPDILLGQKLMIESGLHIKLIRRW